MTFFRSFNPVWNFRDLTGLPLDDTYWAFFLENTIPYVPQAIYATPSGTPLANPLQLTAAGTLPIDVYFDPAKTYRIAIRQGQNESDPLIWLAENYTPAGVGGGSTSASLSSDNQMTNPQFSLVSFDEEGSMSISSSGTYQVAPGWELVLAGTGTATITREALTSAEPNPTNAPYALRLNLVGWNNSGTYLKQRFDQAGMLWSSSPAVNLYVSSSVTAKLKTGANATISARLVDSNASDLELVLPSSTVTQIYTQFTGVSDVMPQPTNTDQPPAAWVEYRLILPGSIDILVTSFQVISTALQNKYNYEQETIERQLDHTYHLARPIVPVGTVIDYFGFGAPEHYLICNGTNTYSRTTYYELFNALTTTETVTLTSGAATFDVADATDYCIDMGLEGDGIVSGSVITGISGTTITMDNNATSTGDSSVRFFLAGFGDSATTFAVPDLRDFVVAGVGGSLFGTASNGLGAKGGAASHELTIAEMPLHDHPGSTVGVGVGGNSTTGPGIYVQPTNGPTSVTVAAQGGGTLNVKGDPHSIVQQTKLARKLIRFE